MISSVIKIFIIVLLSSRVAWSVDCDSQSARENTEKVLRVLESQAAGLSDALKGAPTEANLGLVFERGFKLEDTSSKVKIYREQLESSSGVSPEHEPLVTCLTQLKKNQDVAKLQESSRLLTQLKIDLLNKNYELKNAIASKIDSDKEVPDIKNTIEIENKESEKEKRELVSQVLEVESSITSEKDSKIREVAAKKAQLKKIKIELLNKKIEYNKQLEEKLNYFETKSQFLSGLLSNIDPSNKIELKKKYIQTEEIWTEISSRNYDLFKTGQSFTLPAVPKNDLNLSKRNDLSKELEEVESLYIQLNKQRIETLEELTRKKNQELKIHNELLLQVNNVRGFLYGMLPNQYLLNQFTKGSFYTKLLREITSAPFRIISYFYTKYLYVREQVSKGRAGFKVLAYDILYLVFLGFLLFIVKTVFSNFKSWFDRKVAVLLYRNREMVLVKAFLSLWNKIKDNMEDILWLIFLAYVGDQTFLKDFRIPINIIKVIFISRILRSLVIMFFGSVSRIDVKSFANFKRRAEQSANYFVRIYLFYALSLIVVDATIGRTYIFSIVKVIVIAYTAFRVIMTSSAWEKEFWTYIERNFAGFIVSQLERVFKIVPSKVRATFYFFIIVVLSILNLFIKATENFEISKKVSANIFKKQIERVEAEEGSDGELPEEYKEFFKLNSVDEESDYVTVSEDLETSLLMEIEEWVTGKSDEHSLVVYGDKGVGKTTMMKHCVDEIATQHAESVNVIKTKMPAKITDKKSLYDFVRKTLAQEEDEAPFDLIKIDNNLEKKTVVFIDEAQNVFLSETGGFQAYNALVNLINYSTEKIFWVMSFNKYSWLFLDRAFGRNQFFRNVFEIKGWSDLKIKELIMSRHSKTDYKLSFDLLISATRSQDEIDRYASVESKFFKLLWELSRGNPRAALYLWITALSRKRAKVFNVNIPREVDLDGLEKLPDDLMFVVAHVLKHENLTAKELEKTTNLPAGIVRNAIKVGLEKDFLFKDERQRYMIEIASQFGIIKFLKLKNFVYGS